MFAIRADYVRVIMLMTSNRSCSTLYRYSVLPKIILARAAPGAQFYNILMSLLFFGTWSPAL